MSRGASPVTALAVILLAVGALVATVAADEIWAINVPVADLRAEPVVAAFGYGIDSAQNSQLLYAEPVSVVGRVNGWLKVISLHQMTYKNGTWMNYPGYVLEKQAVPLSRNMPHNIVVTATYAPIFKRSCYPFACVTDDQVVKVSMGTTLVGVKDLKNGWMQVVLADGKSYGYINVGNVRPYVKNPDMAAGLYNTGLKLLGLYYYWGGRSAFSDDMWASGTQTTGVDCSGLVSLVYKVNGINLPRDAHDIYVKTSNFTGPFQVGDAIYLARPKDLHVTHIMMVSGENTLMESSSGNSGHSPIADIFNGTRLVEDVEAFGIPFSQLRYGQPTPKRQNSLIYWSRPLLNF